MIPLAIDREQSDTEGEASEEGPRYPISAIFSGLVGVFSFGYYPRAIANSNWDIPPLAAGYSEPVTAGITFVFTIIFVLSIIGAAYGTAWLTYQILGFFVRVFQEGTWPEPEGDSQ